MTDTTVESHTDTDDDTTVSVLTDRQERFVFEYMVDQNASAAARRCGYSPRSAASTGSALMQIPAIRERVRVEMRQLLADLKSHAMDLIRERMRAAFFRSGKMFSPDGRLLQVQDMDNDMRELLDISVEMRGDLPILRLKQPSREKALAALEKVHDKLDRLDEKHWDQMTREKAAQTSASMQGPPVPMPEFLREEPPADARPSTSSGRTEEGSEEPEKPHDLSRSKEIPAPEKPHDLSGSAPEPKLKLGAIREALEKLRPKKKPEPEEPYDFMKDPNAAWGGTTIKRAPLEPSPALLEHLARVKQEEHNEEVRANLARRGREDQAGRADGASAAGVQSVGA